MATDDIVMMEDSTKSTVRKKTATQLFDWIKSQMKHACRVFRDTSVQTISDQTETAIIFNAENFDTDTMHDNSTNPERITVPKTGLYLLQGQVRFDEDNSGLRKVYFKKNATTALHVTQEQTTDRIDYYISTMEELSANDYVSIYVWHSKGGDLDVNIGRHITFFSATLIAEG